jgi:hypothetical protein
MPPTAEIKFLEYIGVPFVFVVNMIQNYALLNGDVSSSEYVASV